MYLEKINGPEDIKKLNIEELKVLAGETRDALINKISNAGGHNGPNLGMVEMTVAIHFVFNSPNDKIVFDVSHQCYPHKILTGLDEELLNNLKEKHDLVITIEDGELMSGYGQNIASFYGDSKMRVKNYGISKYFHTDFDPDKLLEENGISVNNITNVIKEYINK